MANDLIHVGLFHRMESFQWKNRAEISQALK